MQVLETVCHQHIAKTYELLHDKDHFYIVMEMMADATDLHKFLNQRNKYDGRMTEREVQAFALQLFQALKYLHSQNIMHRDIKLENILVKWSAAADEQRCSTASTATAPKKEKEMHVRLVDFGFATKFQPGAKMRAGMGTRYYVAPEIMLGRLYDSKVDVWSATIVIYVMLCGVHPFKGNDIGEMKKLIAEFDLEQELARYKYFSP